MRARLAIAASGQCCELREVVLRDKPAEMLQASPKGTVPVLVDTDGSVVDQSLDIMQWALRRNDPARWLCPERETADAMFALIAENDGAFKRHLDRYKYPDRYEGIDAQGEREGGATWLRGLDARLQAHAWLFGSRPCLADMAIAPFVRQFAHTDAAWFAAQDWPALQAWLARILDSDAFAHVMQKWTPWASGTEGVAFP
jgi:glutathione S-transferase